MRHLDKVIVNCALTGGDQVPSQSPHIPVTPEEMIDDGIAAANEGASIIHIHARDPETGKPVSDVDIYREISEGIKSGCDAIVLPTTGGSIEMPFEERIEVVTELQPEMATCNMGSINYGLYPILDVVDEFQHDWEQEFLENSKDGIFSNSFLNIEKTIEVLQENGTKPELECYDVGHLYNAKHLVERGIIQKPIQLQFVMGVLGGIGADAENLVFMKRTADKLFGDEYSFSVIGAGKTQFPLGCQSVGMGGHVRVGLEDNVYLRKGELAKSNAELVSKMVELTYELTGRTAASPDETREFLGLKGQEETNF